MQPRTLAIIITLLPLLASNGAYLLSASEGFVPWCIPYIDGCTTISQAGRSGNAIFFFRVSMIAYCVCLIWFWLYAKRWLDLLHGHATKTAQIILWLGLAGMLALIIYIDFLGTSGEVNRFMRRIGVLFYFTLTPLAQLLMLNELLKISKNSPATSLHPGILKYQLLSLLLMLATGFISIALNLTGNKTTITENIVEWNFSLLMVMYFSGMIFLWKDYRQTFSIGSNNT